MEPIITITTTTSDREMIERIGRSLLTKRLIACIQIVGPIKSLYWWRGNVEEENEWLGIMKSRRGLYARVEDEILKVHPYEVPEISAMELVGVSPSYESWIRTETAEDVNKTE